MERITLYFETPGEDNTERTLQLANQTAEAEEIRDIILASTRGYTALQALEICPNLNIIAVGSYKSRSSPKLVSEFKAKGGTHIFAYEAVNQRFTSKDVEYDYSQEIQDAYRSIGGEGGKVAPEVVVAAVKANLVAVGERVIGIGGTFPGADTAFVILAADSFSKLKIQHIICTPFLQ